MKTFGKVALAAVFAFSIGLSQASAQEQDVRQATFGNLIAALNNINAQVRALENVNVEDVEVRVVSADDLLQGANINALNNALNKNQVEIISLRNSEILTNFLNDADIDVDVDVDRVIAVNVLSGGDVVVIFTHPWPPEE